MFADDEVIRVGIEAIKRDEKRDVDGPLRMVAALVQS